MNIIYSNKKIILLSFLFSLLLFFYMYILLFIGISNKCSILTDDCNNVELIIKYIKNIPAWVGSLIGIFISAWLAFKFNVNKQVFDEIKVKLKEEERKANNVIENLETCLDDLFIIKRHYYNYIKLNSDIDDNCISRSLYWPRIIINNFQTVDFKTIDAPCLDSSGDFLSANHPKSQIYMYDLYRDFNCIVILLKERDKLYREFEDYFNISSSSNYFYDINDGLQRFGNHKIYDIIFMSENLFKMVDELLLKLYHQSYEYPIYCFDYLSNQVKINNIKEKGFNISISHSSHNEERVTLANDNMLYFDDLNNDIHMFLYKNTKLNLFDKIKLKITLLNLKYIIFKSNFKK